MRPFVALIIAVLLVPACNSERAVKGTPSSEAKVAAETALTAPGEGIPGHLTEPARVPEQPGDTCTTTVPETCFDVPRATEPFGGGAEPGPVSLEEFCATFPEKLAVRCGFAPGQTVSTTLKRVSGPSRETKYTVPAEAHCQVTLSTKCASVPDLPLTFVDTLDLAGLSAAYCVARADAIAAWCRMPQGATVSAAFHPLPANGQVMTKLVTVAAPPPPVKTAAQVAALDRTACEAAGLKFIPSLGGCRDLVWVFACFGQRNGPRLGTLGFGLGDALSCYEQGYSRAVDVGRLFAHDAPGLIGLDRVEWPVGRKTFVTLEKAALDLSALPAKRLERVGYVAPVGLLSDAPGMKPLFQCQATDPTLPHGQYLETNAGYCESLGRQVAPLGLIH